MKTTIEFKPSASGIAISPWKSTETVKSTTYKDLLIRPEFATRRIKFPVGSTWFRIVPAIRESTKDWLLATHALNYKGGRHVHPRTLTPGGKSVFDHAYHWYTNHRPNDLYSKTNKEGLRLLADPVCVFWMLTEIEGKTVARLFVGSGYDGSRGGMPSLGHKIWQMTQEADKDANATNDPLDPDRGVQICVEKRLAVGARYPSYFVRAGRVVAPINDMIAKMEPQEAEALVPLEQVLALPTAEEEWQILENVIDSETVSQIRESMG